MKAHLSLFIAFMAVYVFLFFASHIMMRIAYHARMKKSYDYLSEFPFEGYHIRSAYGRYSVMVLIAYAISMALAFCFPLLCKDVLPFVAGRDVIMSVMGGVSALAMVLLALLDFTSMRKHLLTFVGFSILFMVTGVVTGFAFLDYRDMFQELAWGFAIPCFALAGLGALVLLNPKLSSWGKLKKVGEGEAAIYVRPRPFMLPFSEWILMTSAFALGVLVMSGMLVIGYQLG